MIRTLLISLISVTSALAAEFPAQHREFLQTHCTACHDGTTQEGNVRLDNIAFDISKDVRTADLWQKVLKALNSGEMPPEDEPQPPAAAKAAFLEDLSTGLVAARRTLRSQSTTPVLRRLNRREYLHTMNDLLGVQIAASELPTDGGAGGFDSNGAALFFSSDQLERYHEIARSALTEALGPPATVFRDHIEFEQKAEAEVARVEKNVTRGKAAAEAFLATGKVQSDPLVEDERKANFYLLGHRDQFPVVQMYQTLPQRDTGGYLCGHVINSMPVFTIPASAAPGIYRVTLRAGRAQDAPASRRFIELCTARKPQARSMDAQDLLETLEINGTLEQPQTIQFEVQAGGKELHFGLRERQPLNPRAALLYHRKVLTETGKPQPPALWLDSLDIEGPINARPSLISGSDPRENIAAFAQKVFRGQKASDDLLDRLVALHEAQQKSGLSYEAAFIEPFAILLVSPGFLYLSESSSTTQPKPLTERELATRLSYFLWSSPPDDELLTLAGKHQLRDQLPAQVARLIADPRAERFVRGFVHQWLTLDRLSFFQFDFDHYRAFDESVKTAARDEVFHFFTHLMRQNLNTAHFLKSDFVIVNPLLADYYGLPAQPGAGWQKITLPADSPRGGLLGMAAILAMGSNGEHTSPVERGAWVLRKLLHDPPPPAPANVPQLARLADKPLTTRQRIISHQEQPQCVHCHRKIDPIGFGLENFDAIGLWRTHESAAPIDETTRKGRKAKQKSGDQNAIDPSDTLHNGPAFADYFELRRIIASRHSEFATSLTETLLEYALGRPITFADQAIIEQLSNHRALGDLLKAIVTSDSFQSK